MKKALKLSSLLLLTLTLTSCDGFSSDDDVSSTAGSGSSTVTPVTSSGTTTESASSYRGRTNGTRPTWYYAKKMSSYPRSFTLNIPGCKTGMIVSHNGSRWESGGYLVKQSDVSGRGMAVLAQSSCNPSGSYITY